MDVDDNSSIESNLEGNLNFLCKPVFEECSDLPNFSRLGIFSCDKCDRWRDRVVNYQKYPKPRSEMAKYQCTRVKKGMPGIKIRVSFKNSRDTAQGARKAVCQAKPLRNENATRISCRVRKVKNVFDSSLSSPVSKRKVVRVKGGETRNAELVHARLEERKQCLQMVNELKDELNLEKQKQQQCHDLINSLKLQLEQEQQDSKQINELQALLKRSQKNNYELRHKLKGPVMKGRTMEEKLCHAIEESCSQLLPGKHCKNKAAALMSALESGKLLKGEVSAALGSLAMKCAKKYVQHMFRPSRLLKACDLGPIGSFRTGTVASLRDIIDEGKEGYFPSATALSRARVALDNHASNLIGWRKEDTKYGEVFHLNKEKTLRLLLKACNLHDLATQQSVKIALSIDGADLIRDRTHVSAGIKITDERGVHPTTKQPLLQTNDDGEDVYVNVQSYQMCCVIVIADARDKKELYEDVFRDFYAWGAKIASQGLPAEDGEPALMPFTVTHASDMKAQWLLSNRGGGCKNKRFFCTYCSCPKEKLLAYKQGEERCDRCKQRGKMRCYHHPVCDTILTTKLLEELTRVLGVYNEQHGKTYEEVKQQSKLKTDTTEANKASDVKHIEFSIANATPEQVRLYAQFISRECMIRGIPLVGDILDWQQALMNSVIIERGLDLLDLAKQWYDSGRTHIPLVEVIEVLIPCLLHLENCVNEKIITCILQTGFNNYVGPKIEYITQVQHCIQTQILGTAARPSQWKLKYSQPTNESIKLDNVQFRNEVGRAFLKKIDVLIEAAITDADLRAKLIYAVSRYTQGMSIVTQHRALEEEQKELFQDCMDDFFLAWTEIFGDYGTTNYIHMLGSGHVLFFLQKYNCLYLYSQQGWEALNNRIQAYIHQNSGRGGRNTGVNGGQSYIYPLVRFVLRDLLWKTGEADRFFAEKEDSYQP